MSAEYVEYGWLGRLNKKNSINVQRGSGTDTSGLIIWHLKNYKAKRHTENGIRSKNLVEKDGKVYYILSIASGRTTWALSPFIEQLKNGYAVLTQDITSAASDERQVNLWVIPFKNIQDLLQNTEITRRKGESYDYYSVSTKILENIITSQDDKSSDKPKVFPEVELSNIPKKLFDNGGTE